MQYRKRAQTALWFAVVSLCLSPRAHATLQADVLPALSPTPPPTLTPLPFPTWTATPAGCEEDKLCIAVGSKSGAPGESVDVEVTLVQDFFATNVIGNDIGMDAYLQIAARADGTPNCIANSTGGASAAFAFLPRGCEPQRDCTGIRAEVRGYGTYSEFGPGRVLYRCRVDIAPDAPALRLPLTISNVAAFTEDDYLVCRINDGTCDPSDPAYVLMGLDGEVLVSGGPGSTPPPSSTLRPTRTPTPTATPCDASCPSVTIGSATGVPGQEVAVAVVFRAGNARVAGLQNDIEFDPVTLIISCAANPEIDKGLTSISVTGDRARALVLGLSNRELADGAVLYTCRIAIAPNAPMGIHPLRGTNVRGSDFTGRDIPMTIESGAVLVAAVLPGATPIPTSTPIPTQTPQPTAPHAVPFSLSLGVVTASAGERVLLPITIANARDSVGGVEAEVTFDPAVGIGATASGSPDCELVAKGGTADALATFVPSECVPGLDCTAVRIQVVSALRNQVGLPDGLLYTCAVAIGGEVPPGRYVFALSGEWAATLSGEPLIVAATDGAVVVTSLSGTPRATWTSTVSPTLTPTPAPAARVEIGTATGVAGTEVRFPVVLRSIGADVVTLRSEITFDPNTPIAITPDGTADCVVNPDINKDLSRFTFEAPRCPAVGDPCMRAHASILGANQDPIPTGSVLYTCNVRIPSDTPPGTYALISSSESAYDAAHADLLVSGSNGQVVVMPAASSTPSAGGRIAPLSSDGRLHGGGCSLNRSGRQPWSYALLLPALLWFDHRRRRERHTPGSQNPGYTNGRWHRRAVHREPEHHRGCQRRGAGRLRPSPVSR